MVRAISVTMSKSLRFPVGGLPDGGLPDGGFYWFCYCSLILEKLLLWQKIREIILNNGK